MPFSTFSQYNYLLDEEDEKKKKPSQVAAQEQKFKTFTRLGQEALQFKEEPAKPAPITTTPARTPSIWETAKKKVGEVVEKVTQAFQPQKLISPIPEETIKPTTPLQQFQARGESIFDTITSTISKSPATVFQEYLARPQQEKSQFGQWVSQGLADTQVEMEKALEAVPALKGFAKGATQMIIGFSPQFDEYWNKKVTVPKDWFGEKSYSAGELAGNVTALVGIPTMTPLNVAGMGKLALPLLFAITGQTSAPYYTKLKDRLASIPNDLVMGYLFNFVPGSKKLLSKETLLGTGAVAGISQLSAFTKYLVQGMNAKDAWDTARHVALVNSLFHVANVGISQLTGTQVQRNEVELTPEQIRLQAQATKAAGTPIEKDLLGIAAKAEAQGKNVRFTQTGIKEAPISKFIGKGATEKLTGQPQEIKMVNGEGKQVVMKVEFVEPQKIELLSEEGGMQPKVVGKAPVIEEKLNKAIQIYVSDEGVYKKPTGETVVTPSLKELTEVAKTPEAQAITKAKVQQAIETGEITPNEQGEITVYRVGTMPTEDRLVSVSLDKASAEQFAEQASVTGKARPVTEVTIKPEDIKVFVGGTEKEVLIQPPKVEKPPEVTTESQKEYKIIVNPPNSLKNQKFPITVEYQMEGSTLHRNFSSKEVAQTWIDERLKKLSSPSTGGEIGKGVKTEFRVGDVLDPQGNTNMVGTVTITEIKGNTLKFTDSKGTEFSGMQRSLVRDLIKGGSWKKISQQPQGQTQPVSEAVSPQKTAGTEGGARVVALEPETLKELKYDPSRLEKTIVPIEPKTEKMITPSGNAVTGTSKIGDFERVNIDKTEESNFKIYNKVKELIHKYAKTVGEGYMPRGALGVYYAETENLRVNGMNDLSVASHEITHFLDFHYNISKTIRGVVGYAKNRNPIYNPKTLSIRKEITDLYIKYYPGGKKTHKLEKRTTEGFATLLQKYTEMPITIKNEYPNLIKEFLDEGGRFYHPIMGEIKTDLKQIVSEYQGLDALDKIGARVTSEKANINKEDFLTLGEKVRTFVADNIYPVEILAKRAGVVFTNKDPSLWVRFYNNSNQVIFNNIYGKKGFYGWRNGEFSKIYDYNYKTLIDGLNKEKTSDAFAYYLVARDQYFNYLELDKLKEEYEVTKGTDRGFEVITEYKELKNVLEKNGFTKAEVTEAYLQNKDKFSQEEKMYDSLVHEDVEFLSSNEVQLVDQERKTKLLSKEGYASLKRQFYDEIVGEEEYVGVAKVGKTKVSSLFRRKGSARTIINPVYSALTNHAEATKKGLKQIVYNRIGDIVSSVSFPELFQKLQLKVVPQENGMITFPQEKDPNIIMTRQNYKRVPILSDNVIKRTIDEVLTHQNIGVFEQILLGTSRFFTKGTTGLFPQFALSNYAIDQITASAQTMNNYIPIYTPLKEFAKFIQDKGGDTNKFFTEYMVLGGEKQTFVGWQDLSPNELFSRIRKEKNGLVKTIDALNSGMDILAIPSKYSEIASRATEYIKSRKAGKSQVVALEEAGRITAPFHHIGRFGGGVSGKIGQTFIKSIPFFNPAIQVLDQSLRTIQSTNGKKRYAFVVFAVTAALISSFWLLMQKGTKEQKQLYKDIEPDELSKYIWIPNPSNKEQLVKIRIPEQMGILGVIINMALSDQILNSQYSFGDYIEAGTSFLPQQFDITNPMRAFLSWLPQIFKPATMVVAGIKDFPKVIPMESQTLKNLPPKYRYTESTSTFAKWLGDKLRPEWDISPIKIDYLITGYFGRASGFLMGKQSVYNPFSSVIRNYYFTSGRTISNFYDRKEQVDLLYKEIIPDKKGKVLKKVSLTEKMKVKREKNQLDEIGDLLSDFRKIDIEKEPIKASRLREQILTKLNKLESK